jgi:hypothetical protein
LRDPPKFIQIGIFVFKICHLATLAGGGSVFPLRKDFRSKIVFVFFFAEKLKILISVLSQHLVRASRPFAENLFIIFSAIFSQPLLL